MSSRERWKAVVGFEGKYEVSDQGRVRSLDRYVSWQCRYGDRLVTVGRNQAGRLLRQCAIPSGHFTITIEGETRRVHDLVLTAFIGPRPDGLQGCHEDDDKANNRLSNLRWDTPASNARDAVRNNRMTKGEACHSAKLRVRDIPIIRKLLKTKSGPVVAKIYGVRSTAIYRIRHGITWRHA